MTVPIRVPAMLGGETSKRSAASRNDRPSISREQSSANNAEPLAGEEKPPSPDSTTEPGSATGGAAALAASNTQLSDSKAWSSTAVPTQHSYSLLGSNLQLGHVGVPALYLYSAHRPIPVYILSISPRIAQVTIRVPSAYNIELTDIFLTVPMSAVSLIPYFRPEGLLSAAGTLAYSSYLKGDDSVQSGAYAQALRGELSDTCSVNSSVGAPDCIDSAWKIIQQTLQTAETNLVPKLLLPTRCNAQFLGALSPNELAQLGLAEASVSEAEPTEVSGILNTEYSDIVSEVNTSISTHDSSHRLSKGTRKHQPQTIHIGDMHFSSKNPLFRHPTYTCLRTIVDREVEKFRFIKDVPRARGEILNTISNEFLLSMTAIKSALDIPTTRNLFVGDALLSSSGLGMFSSTHVPLVDAGTLYTGPAANSRTTLRKQLEDDFANALHTATSERVQRFTDCHNALNATLKFQPLFHTILNKYLTVLFPEISLFVLSLGTIKESSAVVLIDSFERIFRFLEENALRISHSGVQPGSHVSVVPYYNVVILLDDLRREIVSIATKYMDCLTPSIYTALLRMVLGLHLCDHVQTSLSSGSTKLSSQVSILLKDSQLPSRKADTIMQLQQAISAARGKKRQKLKTAQFYTHLNKVFVEQVLSSVACLMYEEYIRIKRASLSAPEQGTQSSASSVARAAAPSEYPEIKVYMHFVRILVNICAEEYTDAILRWHTDILERLDVMKARSMANDAITPAALAYNQQEGSGVLSATLQHHLEALGLSIITEEEDTLANMLMIELNLMANINEQQSDIQSLYTYPSPEDVLNSLRELFFCVLENANYMQISIDTFFRSYICNGIIPRDDLFFLLPNVGRDKVLREYRDIETQILSHLKDSPAEKIITETLATLSQATQTRSRPLVNVLGWNNTQNQTPDSPKLQQKGQESANIGKEVVEQYIGRLSEAEMFEYTQLAAEESKLVLSLLFQRKLLLANWDETMFQYQLRHETELYNNMAVTQTDVFGHQPFLNMCAECGRKISVSPAPEPVKELFDELFDSLLGIIKLTCDFLHEEVGLKELRKLADKTVLLQNYPELDSPQATALPPAALFNLNADSYNLLFLLGDNAADNLAASTADVQKAPAQEKAAPQGAKATARTEKPTPMMLTFNDANALLRKNPPFALKLVHNATTLIAKLDEFVIQNLVSLPIHFGNEVVRFDSTRFKQSVIDAMRSLRSTVVSHVQGIMKVLTDHSLHTAILTESIMDQSPRSPDDLGLMIESLGQYNNFVKVWIPVTLLLTDLLMEMGCLGDGYLDFVVVAPSGLQAGIQSAWGSFSMSFALDGAVADGTNETTQKITTIVSESAPHDGYGDCHQDQSDILPLLSKEQLCYHEGFGICTADNGNVADTTTSIAVIKDSSEELMSSLFYFNNKPHRSFNVQVLVAKIFRITRLQKMSRHIVKSQTRTFARHLLKLSDWISDTAALLHEYYKEVTRLTYSDIFIARYYPRKFRESFPFLTRNIDIQYLDDNFEILEDELVAEFLDSTQAQVSGFQLYRTSSERARLRATQPSTRSTIRVAAIQETAHSAPLRARFAVQYFRPAENELLSNVFTDITSIDLSDQSIFTAKDDGPQALMGHMNATLRAPGDDTSETFSLTSLQTNNLSGSGHRRESLLGKSVAYLRISDLHTGHDAGDGEKEVAKRDTKHSLHYNMFHIFNEILYVSDVLDCIHQTALRWADCLGVTLNLVENPAEIVKILRPASTIILSLYSIKQRCSTLKEILLRDTDVQDIMDLLRDAANAIVIGKETAVFKAWKETIQALECDLVNLGPQVFYLHCMSSPSLREADLKQLAEELSLPITEEKRILNSQLLGVADFDSALRLARKVFTRAEQNKKTLEQLEEVNTFMKALQIFPCSLTVYLNLSEELAVLFNKWQNSESSAEEAEEQHQEVKPKETKEPEATSSRSQGKPRGRLKMSLVVPLQNGEGADASSTATSKPALSVSKSQGSRAMSRLAALKLQVDAPGATDGAGGDSSDTKDQGASTSVMGSVPGRPLLSKQEGRTPSNMLTTQNQTTLPFIRVHSGLMNAVREALFFVVDILARKHPQIVQVRARQLEVQLLLFRSALISISRLSTLLPEVLYIFPRLTIVRNGVQDMSFLSLYNEFGDYKRSVFTTLNVLRDINKAASTMIGPGSFLMLINQRQCLLSQLARCTRDLSDILKNVYAKVLAIPLIPHYNNKPVACALFLPKIPSIFYNVFSLQEHLNVLYYCPAVYQSVLPNFDRILLGNYRTMKYRVPESLKKATTHGVPHLGPSDVIIVGLESGFERLYFEYGLRAPQELFLLSGMLTDMRLQREGLMREHKRAFLLLMSCRFQEFLCTCLYQSIVYALSAAVCLHLDGSVDRFLILKFTIIDQLKRHLMSSELHDNMEQKVDYLLLLSEFNLPESYINVIRRQMFGFTHPMSNDDEILAKNVEATARVQYYKQRRCQRYITFKAIAARVFEYDQLLNMLITQTIEYYNKYYADIEQAAAITGGKGAQKKAKKKVEPFPMLDLNTPLNQEAISNLRTLLLRVHGSKVHQPVISSAGCSLKLETNKIFSGLTYGIVTSAVMKDPETGEFIKPPPNAAAPPTEVMMTAEDAMIRGTVRGFGRTAVSIGDQRLTTPGKKSGEGSRVTDAGGGAGAVSDSGAGAGAAGAGSPATASEFTLDCKLYVGSGLANLGPHYLGKATILDSLALNHKQLSVATTILIGAIQRKPVFLYSDKLRGYNMLDTKIIAQYVSRMFCTRHIFLSLTSYSSADAIVLQILSYFMAGYGIYLHGVEFLSTEHHARLVDCFNTIYLARGVFPIVRYQSGGSVPGELAINDFTNYTFTGYIVIILPELIYREDGSMCLSTTGKQMNNLFAQTKIDAFLDSFGSTIATSATKLNTILTSALCNLSVTLPTGGRQALSSGPRLTNERGDLPDGKPRCKILTQLYGAILTDFQGMTHFDPLLTKISLKYMPNSESFTPVVSNHILYHLFKKKSEAHAESFYEIAIFLNSTQNACPKLYPDDIDVIFKRAKDTTNAFSVSITTSLMLAGQAYSVPIREFIIKVVATAFHLTGPQVMHITRVVGSLNKLLNLSKDDPGLKKSLIRNPQSSRTISYEAAAAGASSSIESSRQDRDKQDSDDEDLAAPDGQGQAAGDTITINYARNPTASLSHNIWMHMKQTLSQQYAQVCEAAAEQANIIGSLGADMLLTCLEYMQLGPCALFSNNQSIQILECYATILSKFGRLQPFFIHSINDLHHHSDAIRRLGASALVILLINDSTGNLGPSLYSSLLAFLNPIPHLSLTNGTELEFELATMFNVSPTSDNIVCKYGRPKILVITTGSFLDDKMLSTPLGLIPRRIVIDSSVMRTAVLIKLVILNSFKASAMTANNMLDYIHDRMVHYTIHDISDLKTARQYFQRMCTPECKDETSALQLGLRRLRFISNLFYLLVLQYCEQATTVFSMALDLRGWRIFRTTFYYNLVCSRVCVFNPPEVRMVTADQLAGKAIANDLSIPRRPAQPQPPTQQSAGTPSAQGHAQAFKSSWQPQAAGSSALQTSRTVNFAAGAGGEHLSSAYNTSRGPKVDKPHAGAGAGASEFGALVDSLRQAKTPMIRDSVKAKKDTNIELMNSLIPPAEYQFQARPTINLSHVWCAEHVGSFSSALAMFAERRFTFFDLALSDEFLIEYVYKAESYEQACFNLMFPVFAAVWNSAALTYTRYLGGKVNKLPKMWLKYLSYYSKHTIPLLTSRFSNDKVLQKSVETCLIYIEESLPPEYPYDKYKYAYLAIVNEKDTYMRYTAANRRSGRMPSKETSNPILKAGRSKLDVTAVNSNSSKGPKTIVPPLSTGLLGKNSIVSQAGSKEGDKDSGNHYSAFKFLPYEYGRNMMETDQTANYLKPASVHELVRYFDMLRSQIIFFIAICVLGGVPMHIIGPRYSGKTTLIQAAHALIQEYCVFQLYLPSTCEPNHLFLSDAARELYLVNNNELRFPGQQLIHMHFVTLFLDNGRFEKTPEALLDELTKRAGLDIAALFLGERVLILNAPGNISISPEGDSHQALLGTADTATICITFESEFVPPQLLCSQLVNIYVPGTSRSFLIDLLLAQKKYIDLAPIVEEASLASVVPVASKKPPSQSGATDSKDKSRAKQRSDAPATTVTRAVESLSEFSGSWVKQLVDGILLVKDQIPVNLLKLLSEIKRLSIFCTTSVKDVQMQLFTASSIFMALRFISNITVPTIITIMDALRGALAMGKLSPTGPWGILNTKNVPMYAKANKLLNSCGATKLQFELSWEAAALQVARDCCKVLEDSETTEDSDDHNTDTGEGASGTGTELGSQGNSDYDISEMASSYVNKKPLKQPPAILRHTQRQIPADPSLVKFEESPSIAIVHGHTRAYTDMRRKLKVLLGLKAFRGVDIAAETRQGLRQTNDNVFQAYISAFRKYIVMRCSPGLANRIFIVYLTVQYELALRARNVPLLLQSLTNPRLFKRKYGEQTLNYFSNLRMDVVTTILRKQDISSSLLDIVLMLAAFGNYKIYGGRALIKLLLRVPTKADTCTASPAAAAAATQQGASGSKKAHTQIQSGNHKEQDRDQSKDDTILKALASIKKKPEEKDNSHSSSSMMPVKKQLLSTLDSKTRDALEIEHQLERYSAFNIDDSSQLKSKDGSSQIEKKVYRLLISVDVFLAQQNMEMSDEFPVPGLASDKLGTELNLNSSPTTSPDAPSELFSNFIKALIKTVGRQGAPRLVYYLLRGVFLLALQLNPMLALTSIKFLEAMQFCKINNGVNPDIVSSAILQHHMKDFGTSYGLASMESLWVKPIYSFCIVSSLAHLQHLDSLTVIHGLSTLGHAGNISLRLFTPPELVTLCLLVSERHRLGVVIEVNMLITIASRNMTVLLIADMPTELRMKLPESPVLRHFATDISAVPMHNLADREQDNSAKGRISETSKDAGGLMSRVVNFSIVNTCLIRKTTISQIPQMLLRRCQQYFSIDAGYFTRGSGYSVDLEELDRQGKMYRGVHYSHLLATVEAFSASTLQTYLFITAHLLPNTIFLTFDKFAELSKELYDQRINYYSTFLHSCDKILYTIKLLNNGLYYQVFPPTIRENILAYRSNLTTLKNYLYPYYKRALVLVRNATCDCPATIARIYGGSLRDDAIASDDAFELALLQHLKVTGFDKLSIMQSNTSDGFANSMFGSISACFDAVTDTCLRDVLDEIDKLFDDCESAYVNNKDSVLMQNATQKAPKGGKNYSEILLAKSSTLPFNLTGFPSSFLGECLDSFFPQWDVAAACHLTRYIFFTNATMLQEILALVVAISLGTRLCFIEGLLLYPLAIASELHFLTTIPSEYEEHKEELEVYRNTEGRYRMEDLASMIFWINSAQSTASFNIELSKAFAQTKAIGFTNVLLDNVTTYNVHQTAQEEEMSIINMRTLLDLFKVVGARISDKQTPIKVNGIAITPCKALHDYRYYIGLTRGTHFSSIISSGILSFETVNASIIIQPKYSNLNLYFKYLDLQKPDASELQITQTYNFSTNHMQNVLIYLTSSIEKTRVISGHRLLTHTMNLVQLVKRSSEINSKFIIEKFESKLRQTVMNPDTFVHLFSDDTLLQDADEANGASAKPSKTDRQDAASRTQEKTPSIKKSGSRISNELTDLLYGPTPYLDFELIMRISERSIALANYRIRLERQASEHESTVEFAYYCARGMTAMLIVCQKLSCAMPTLARLFSDHFFAHFFLHVDEQMELPKWKGVPLQHMMTHIIMPFMLPRIHSLVPSTWAAPLCNLLAVVFSCALSECSVDNLRMLKFILAPDLREKAITVNPLYNAHDERYVHSRELINAAPFSFKASIATDYTWKNIAILYPFSDRISSWLNYFSNNNFTFVSLVTNLNPYKMIIGHYIFKESQRNPALMLTEVKQDSNMTTTTSISLFTKENMLAHYRPGELPLPNDIQLSGYNNIFQSFVFSLAIIQLHLRDDFRFFTNVNQLTSFTEEVAQQETRAKTAHEVYCKNQGLIPELTYRPVSTIPWYITLVCGYIPTVDTFGKVGYKYDPAKFIEPTRTSDTRYAKKMSSKSYADGIGSHTLVIFYEEGISLLDIIIDSLERGLSSALNLAPHVITSRPTEDDFRTKTVIVDASMDTKETIDLLIMMFSRGWRATSLLIVFLPVKVGQVYGEEGVMRKVQRAGLLSNDTNATRVAAVQHSAECINLSRSLMAFLSISTAAHCYVESPKTLSEAMVYFLTISLRLFDKFGVDIPKLSPRAFKLFFTLLTKNSILQSARGHMYSDKHYLTCLLHLIGKNSERVFISSSKVLAEYMAAGRGVDGQKDASQDVLLESNDEAYIAEYSSLFGPHPISANPVLMYLNTYYNKNAPRLVLGRLCKGYAITGATRLILDSKFEQNSLALVIARARMGPGGGDDENELEDLIMDAQKGANEETSSALSSLSMSSAGSNLSSLSSQNTVSGSEGYSAIAQQMINLKDDAIMVESRLEVTTTELTEIVPRGRHVTGEKLSARAADVLRLPAERSLDGIKKTIDNLKRIERHILLKSANKQNMSLVELEELSSLSQEDLDALEAFKYQTFNMIPSVHDACVSNRMHRELFSAGLTEEVINFLDNKSSCRNIFTDITIQQAEADLPKSLKTILYLSDGYMQNTRTTVPYFNTTLTEKMPIIKLHSEYYWEMKAEVYQHVLGNIMQWAALFCQNSDKSGDKPGEKKRKAFILLPHKPSVIQQYKLNAQNDLVVVENTNKKRKLDKKDRDKVDTEVFTIKLTGFRLFNIAYDPIEESIADCTPESALGYVQTYTFYAVLVDTDYCEYSNAYSNRSEFDILMDISRIGLDIAVTGQDAGAGAEGGMGDDFDDFDELMKGRSCCSTDTEEEEVRYVSIPVILGGTLSGIQLFLRNKTAMTPLDITLKGAYCSTGHIC